jgi:uncharacterized protein YecT (DUF1311 family)
MKKLLLLSTLLLSAGAWANCEIKQSNPSSIATCYEKQSFAKVTFNLNKLKELSKDQLSYNPTIIKELESSQKAWLAYRDSYCTTYSNYHSEINNHANCIISLNNQRSDQLKNDINAN